MKPGGQGRGETLIARASGRRMPLDLRRERRREGVRIPDHRGPRRGGEWRCETLRAKEPLNGLHASRPSAFQQPKEGEAYAACESGADAETSQRGAGGRPTLAYLAFAAYCSASSSDFVTLTVGATPPTVATILPVGLTMKVVRSAKP